MVIAPGVRPLSLRQLAGGDAAAAVQDAEAAEVGAVQAELQRDRLVQLVAGPAQLAEFDADVVDERGLLGFIVLHLYLPVGAGTLPQGL